MSACVSGTPDKDEFSDYTETDQDDTGTITPPDTTTGPTEREHQLFYQRLVPQTDGSCLGERLNPGRTTFDGFRLVNANYVGFRDGADDCPTPRLNADLVASVRIERTHGVCDATTSTEEIQSYDPQPSGDGDKWHRFWNSGDLFECGGVSGCANTDDPMSCSGTYRPRMFDVPSPYVCNDIFPTRIDFELVEILSAQKSPAQSDCTPGAGRFRLLPVHGFDHDRDGRYAMSFLPFQTSGTGVMTRRAWVTSISPVSVPSGYTLRAVHEDAGYDFSAADQLNNATAISTAITQPTTFATGAMMGSPAFTVSEIMASESASFEVDMAWSCGTGGTTVTRPQGYQFRLSDIGCPATQKMTLRYVNTAPKRVMIEQYGNAAMSKVEPTVTTGQGQAFVFEVGDLMIDGAVVSATSTQAVVRIDEVTWNGVSACTPGTYTFEVE